MPSDQEAAGKLRDEDSMSDFEKDNLWYESFADKVLSFGKKWPDPITDEEFKACTDHADTVVRRPRDEMWDL